MDLSCCWKNFHDFVISMAQCCLFHRHVNGFKYKMAEVEVEICVYMAFMYTKIFGGQ